MRIELKDNIINRFFAKISIYFLNHIPVNQKFLETTQDLFKLHEEAIQDIGHRLNESISIQEKLNNNILALTKEMKK